jgi:hypothetical protein
MILPSRNSFVTTTICVKRKRGAPVWTPLVDRAGRCLAADRRPEQIRPGDDADRGPEPGEREHHDQAPDDLALAGDIDLETGY